MIKWKLGCVEQKTEREREREREKRERERESGEGSREWEGVGLGSGMTPMGLSKITGFRILRPILQASHECILNGWAVCFVSASRMNRFNME